MRQCFPNQLGRHSKLKLSHSHSVVLFGGGCRGLCQEWAAKFSDRKKLPKYNLNSKHPPQPPLTLLIFFIKEGVRYPRVGQLPPLQSFATTLPWNWPLYHAFEGGDGGNAFKGGDGGKFPVSG